MFRLQRPLFVAIAVLLFNGAAQAQSVRLVGDFRDWSAYATAEGAGATCFAMSKPKDVSPTPDGYTQAYLYLSHNPGARNEMNLVAGYGFAPDTPAVLTIGGQNYDLFTEKDAAWLLDPAQNDALAGSMRAGSSLAIEGTSDKGIKIVETFSLSGATAASKAIESGC